VRTYLWAAVWLALASALSPASASAQQGMTSATVSGTVRDASDAIVPGATVRIRNHQTNQVWESITDDRGRFRLLYIPVGDYHLSAELEGFTTVNVNLTLAVGQTIDVPLTLQSASVSETVSVSGQAPIVETARTQVADTITPRDIDTLPLNGRNYLDLALLAPNVSRTTTRSNDRFAETSAVPGSGISVAGQRNLGNTFIVDGLSANDDAADLAGTYYGEEVIREFQVVTSGGTAEYGRASAGTVNIVTQSGTNDLRGRVYGFFRDDRLDARNALATTKDPLTQNQYGFSLGGPLARDRTFWFANIERTQQDKTGFVTIAPANAAAVNQAFDRFGYRGPRLSTGPFATGYRTTNLFGRVDHQATAGSRLELRYSVYDVGSPNARGVGGLSDVSRGTRLDDRDQTAAVSVLSSLSSTVINEARAQYTHSILSAPVNDPIGPAFTISGIATSGTSTSSPTARDLDVVQAADTLTLQRGAHLVKTGVDLLYDRTTITFPGALQGSYTFSSIANLQRGDYVQYQQAFGEPSLLQSNPNLGLFVQDEWRLRGNVTVNGGVRYDLQRLPSPIHLDADNLSPRIGVAWSPGDQQTVIRASTGLYFDRIPLRATANALQRDGIKYKVAVLSFGQDGAPAFPAVLPAFPADVVTATTSIDPAIQNGFSQQAAVQIERGLGRFASATAGYSSLRGHDIIMQRNINVPTLTPAQASALGVANLGRPDAAFGNINQYQSIGDSWFNGLTMSVGTRNAVWGSARVSYTLSQSLDDAGNAFFQTPQDNFDVLADKGPSDNDQRHRLVVSGAFGAAAGAAGRLPGGVQVGYVLSYATGVPFNPVTGTDRNNDTTVNDRPAGVGRNSARQPSTSAFDLRVSRTFAPGGHRRIETMVEAFNVFNHVNVLNVNNTFGTGTSPSPTFGQPTVAGDPRQVQLGIRWSF
jgi:carboxypeptidase family protein/TonB-dependent receptor-like protein